MQAIFATLILHISFITYESPPRLKYKKITPKEQVLALLEKEEKKRETKVDIKIRARL